jgi:hypothetical protein
VDVQRALALVDAVDGALLDACLVLDVDAGLGDHVGHGRSLRKEHGSDLVSPRRALGPTGKAAMDKGWTDWPVGARVVVRRRLPDGRYSDVLGELLAADDDGVRVRTRLGDVSVPGTQIAVGKVVPPARPGRGRPRRLPPTEPTEPTEPERPE